MAESSICLFNPKQSFEEIEDRLAQVSQLISQNSPAAQIFFHITRIKTVVNEYEAQPKALDKVLQTFISTVSECFLSLKSRVNHDESLSSSLAELVYLAAKIRGHKFVVNYFSSDVYLFGTLIPIIEEEATQKSDFESFLILLWLSKLVLVPFPLCTITQTLPDSILHIATKFLTLHSNASKTQVISSALLASLLTRKDCKQLFVSFEDRIIENWASLDENFKLGHMMTINQILKKPYSGPVAGLAVRLHPEVLHYEITRITYDSIYKVGTLNVTFLIKLLSKCARYHIKDGEYDLVATVVNNITNLVNSMSSSFDANLRECAAKNLSRVVSLLSPKALNYSSQLVDYMIQQLRLKPLPNHEYQLAESDLNVSRYHTILLFLGFLALTKELPLDFVPVLLGICNKTIFMSPRTYSFIQDSYIRDASCFCLWAVLRMLKLDQYANLQKEHLHLVHQMFHDLIKVSIFDESYLIRRCSLAVLQEFAGRFGSSYFQVILGSSDGEAVGEFAISFMELFGTENVMNMKESHKVVESLMKMGFDKSFFIEPLLDEVLDESAAFEVKKIGGSTLAKTLASTIPSKLQILPAKMISSHHINESVLQDSKGSKLAFYTLGELHSHTLLENSEVEQVCSYMKQLNFNHKRESSASGEALMHWILSCQSDLSFTTNEIMPLILEISKLPPTESLIFEFRRFFAQSNLPGDVLEAMINSTRMGNIIVASSITHYRLSSTDRRTTNELMCDRRVDAELRAVMIGGLQLQNLAPEHVGEFMEKSTRMMSDYTLSARGDVGSLVRLAVIELLQSHKELSRPYLDIVKPQLLQIAGEGLDNVRVAAFGLLCSLENVAFDEPTSSRYRSDYDAYFADYFRVAFGTFITETDHCEAFWKGITHSAGATTGGRSLINKAFREVLRHLSNEANLQQAWMTLLRFLRIPPGQKVSDLNKRHQKLVNNTLTMFTKIFDSALSLPPNLNFDALYIRAFNLHINTISMSRIGSVLHIFQHMSTHPSVPDAVRANCRKRLCFLACEHSDGHVRALAGYALLEVAFDNELSHSVVKKLENTDWEKQRLGPTETKLLEKIYLNI